MTIRHLPAFTVIGIAQRTNNAREMSPEGIIGPMWDRIVSGNLLDKIPNRADTNVLAMYTDYESDAKGDYTFFIGPKVVSSDVVPEGMIAKTIGAARYAVFTSDRGPLYEVVPRLWQRIWSMPADELGGERAYLADLEFYDERALNPSDAVMEVWVEIK